MTPLTPNSTPDGIGLLTSLAFGRALFVAMGAIGVSGPLAQWLRAQRGHARTAASILVAAPFFTPPLLVSYAFSKVALALLVSPWSHEALYVGVLALKLMPVAVALRILLPPALSAEGRHIYERLGQKRGGALLLFRLRGAGQGPWLAGGVVFLLSFADFELASLWSVKTWTTAVFDAQVGGQAVGATLRLAAWPLVVQLCLLVALYCGGRDAASTISATAWEDAPVAFRRRALSMACGLFVATSAVCVCFVPLMIVARQAIAGIPSLPGNFVLGRAWMASVACAAAAAAASTVCALSRRRVSLPAALVGALGLLGSLTISLLLLALFQMPVFRFFYHTPLPWSLALAVLLWPLALLLAVLSLEPSPASHIARLVGSRSLLWDLQTRPRAVAIGLLFCWAYFDCTASTILAPTGFTPVFARLHNLARDGQHAVVSAMLLPAFATPILVLLLTGTAWRLYARGHGR